MSFITQEQAEQILGDDFAPAGDKARLIKLANTWMRNEVGYVPDPIDPLLIDAACEIIKGIQAGVIFAGVARRTTSESVKADTVKSLKALLKVVWKYQNLSRLLVPLLTHLA